jgi:hypothetical protein
LGKKAPGSDAGRYQGKIALIDPALPGFQCKNSSSFSILDLASGFAPYFFLTHDKPG